jgi:hypothetical protein
MLIRCLWVAIRTQSESSTLGVILNFNGYLTL